MINQWSVNSTEATSICQGWSNNAIWKILVFIQIYQVLPQYNKNYWKSLIQIWIIFIGNYTQKICHIWMTKIFRRKIFSFSVYYLSWDTRSLRRIVHDSHLLCKKTKNLTKTINTSQHSQLQKIDNAISWANLGVIRGRINRAKKRKDSDRLNSA